jgi:protein-S-isoprenylcysteine O-methyltransferase Ste14
MTVALGRFFFRFRNALFPLAIALDALPSPELFLSPTLAAGVGGAVALAGAAVRALTVGLDYIVRGGRGGRVHADDLVTGGLFAHCRNPLYVGNLLIITGLAVAADSVVALAVAPPLFLFAYHCIVSAEESYLEGRFGDRYREYCAATPRFGIRGSGLGATIAGSPFHWRRVVVKEYGTIFALFSGFLLLMALNYVEQQGLELARAPLLGLAKVFAFAALAWLVTWYLKKARRLVGD